MEWKYYNFDGVSASAPTGWYYPAGNGSLFRVAQGAGVTGRIGNTVYVSDVDLTFELAFERDFTSTLQDAVYRLILFEDSQNNSSATAPSSNDVMDNAANYDWLGYQNVDNERRFHILWDHLDVINPNYVFSTTSGQNFTSPWSKVVLRVNVPLDRYVQFSGTGGSLSDIAGSTWHVLFHSSTSTVRITTKSRVRYCDV